MIRPAATTRPPTRPARRGAFTFIEILATLTLLSIVLPSVMNGISLSLSTAQFARQQSQAAALARSKLTDLVVNKEWQYASLAGDFGGDWPEFRWKAETWDWDGGVMRELSVTVLWQQRRKERSVSLSTLVYTGGTQ